MLASFSTPGSGWFELITGLLNARAYSISDVINIYKMVSPGFIIVTFIYGISTVFLLVFILAHFKFKYLLKHPGHLMLVISIYLFLGNIEGMIEAYNIIEHSSWPSVLMTSIRYYITGMESLYIIIFFKEIMIKIR